MSQVNRNFNDQHRLSVLRKQISMQPAARRIAISPHAYASHFKIGRQGSYGALNPELRAEEASIAAVSPKVCLLYNQYLLVALLDGFKVPDGNFRVPESVAALYERDLERMERQLAEREPEFFRLHNDAFLKDLAILRHQLIPVGAEYAFPKSGVPRSLLFKAGAAQFCKGLWSCAIQSRGFSPFLELHAHILALEDFNPEGWRQTYTRLAELLEANPHFRGVTSSSWFLDPALEVVSPHLAYLREEPEQHGATILFSSWDKKGESGALAKSSTRRHLFETGKYTPAIYTRIWPRKKLISWKNQQLGD